MQVKTVTSYCLQARLGQRQWWTPLMMGLARSSRLLSLPVSGMPRNRVCCANSSVSAYRSVVFRAPCLGG